MAKPTRTITKVGYNKREPVKIATSNLFIETGQVPVDYMVGAIFGEIGGQEYLAYEPSDFLTNPNSFPIANVATTLNTYSSSRILFPVDGTLSIIPQFPISLNSYTLPSDSTTNQYRKLSNPLVYIDSDFQNVIILLEDGAENFEVEVEFLSGTV
jgi:hypothetical protein